MKLSIYQVDAFAGKRFEGNPAAVVPLNEWLSDELMQLIAMENNLAETAFYVPNREHFDLRWFTPAVEVDLCGHATLATAHVLFQHLDYKKASITFNTKSGALTVGQTGDSYIMDFPADIIVDSDVSATDIGKMLGDNRPLAVFRGKDDYMAVFNNQSDIENLVPDFRKIATLKSRGLIVTATGEQHDFVSRCFFPQSGIDEDPVTGSAHTLLTPYWSKQLNKPMLSAKQLSARTGELVCQLVDDRVLLTGNAITYLSGNLLLE